MLSVRFRQGTGRLGTVRACQLWKGLHLGSYHGHTETVKILVKHGANINVQNQYGQTPLMMAVGEDHPNTAQALVKYVTECSISGCIIIFRAGADTTIQTKKKSTALTMAKTVEMKAILVLYPTVIPFIQ